jgi:hypothetical protein
VIDLLPDKWCQLRVVISAIHHTKVIDFCVTDERWGRSEGVVTPLPEIVRELMQGLKKIVNHPEMVIFVTLQDCNMDLNETVNRLLS